MPRQPSVHPLSRSHRSVIFFTLLFAFLASLPLLYFFANGYTYKESTIVRTGGIYIGVELTGADIYADGELVRETTRTFRRAFYLQNLTAGTHRLHVQKDGYHTWVKELPVVAHRVTEAQAFNLPLVPQVRVISEWQSATGSAVVRSALANASTTNEVIATTTTKNTTFSQNIEFTNLIILWKPATTTATSSRTATITNILGPEEIASTSPATTTKARGEVRLIEVGEDIFAHWVGTTERMPYYYCAEDFPRYSTSSPTTTPESVEELPLVVRPIDEPNDTAAFMHPIQTVNPNIPCDPRIRLDRKWQTVRTFDFAPRSTDHVLLALADGIYMVEIDDRAWQNVQPVLMGENLDFKVVNDVIYVYDGTLIYQIVLEYS